MSPARHRAVGLLIFASLFATGQSANAVSQISASAATPTAASAATPTAASASTPTAQTSASGTASSIPDVPASSNSGSGSVTFGIQPASDTGSTTEPDDRPYFQYGVTPGSIVQDNAAITNFSTRPLQLQIYSTDSVNTADGGFSALAQGQQPTDAGSWTSLSSRRTVSVPARSTDANGNQQAGRVIIPFTVTVPDNASPGDHVGGIVASLNSSSNGSNTSVELAQRVVTRMYIRVTGPLHPVLAVSGLHVSYRGSPNPLSRGTATVTFTVSNKGNVALTARQTVTLHGPFGLSTAAAVIKQLPLLLPGAGTTVTLPISGARAEGQLTAAVGLSQISSPGHASSAAPDVHSTASCYAIPYTIVLIIAFGLALAAVLGWRLKRSRRRPARAGRHHQVRQPRRGTVQSQTARANTQPANSRPAAGRRRHSAG